MDFQKLFNLQKNLDDRILHNHNVAPSALLSKKTLALQVELSELANETKCFKYWSTKSPSSKENIMEEYVDCLHFILSIGLEKKYTDLNLTFQKPETELTKQFLNLYIDINDFIICSSKDTYITLFEDFLSLGLSLGFTPEAIEKGYFKKNLINHARQVNGY